jgi:hypothetical protein
VASEEMWNNRLIVTAAFHGIFAMSSAYYMTILNSLEQHVRMFANESLSEHYDSILPEDISGSPFLDELLANNFNKMLFFFGKFQCKYYQISLGRRRLACWALEQQLAHFS